MEVKYWQVYRDLHIDFMEPCLHKSPESIFFLQALEKHMWGEWHYPYEADGGYSLQAKNNSG